MFNNLKMCSFSGDEKYNADTYNFTSKSIWVVDGSTPNHTRLMPMGLNTASWISNVWHDFLVDNADSFESLKELLEAGVKNVQTVMSEHHCVLSMPELPSVSLGIALVSNNKLSVYVIGGCDVIVSKRDGSIELVEDSDVFKYEMEYSGAISDVSSLLGVGHVHANKMLGGVKSGHVLSVKQENIELGVLREYKISDIDSVCAVSDGVSRYYKVFGLGDHACLVNEIKSDKYLDVLDKLKWLSSDDYGCIKYPRIKPTNDMTLIYGGIQNELK